jgi:uncharacterized protein
VEMFASLLAEVRAYGEGLVVAEQIPAKLIPDVIKNTAVKIVHRLPAQDDRDAVGATMNLSPAQSTYLVTLEPGTAGVFSDGMDQPLLVHMPDGTAVERQGPVDIRDASEIVQRSTGRCQADYGLTDTTLADMVRGQRLVEDNALLRWWVEVAVIAHLVGSTTPNVPPDVRDLLDRTPDSKVIACALSYAVDEAVATRSSLLHKRMGPAALAGHVAASLSGLVDGRYLCKTPEMEWLAEPFLLDPRYRQLLGRVLTDTGDGPAHPRLRHWTTFVSRSDGGESSETSEFDEVHRARRAALHENRERTEALLFGSATPSALEQSIDIRRDEPDWPEAVRRMSTELRTPWVAGYLILEPSDMEGEEI